MFRQWEDRGRRGEDADGGQGPPFDCGLESACGALAASCSRIAEAKCAVVDPPVLAAEPFRATSWGTAHYTGTLCIYTQYYCTVQSLLYNVQYGRCTLHAPLGVGCPSATRSKATYMCRLESVPVSLESSECGGGPALPCCWTHKTRQDSPVGDCAMSWLAATVERYRRRPALAEILGWRRGGVQP